MNKVDVFFLNIRSHPDIGKVSHSHERSGGIVSKFAGGCQNIEHLAGERRAHDQGRSEGGFVRIHAEQAASDLSSD